MQSAVDLDRTTAKRYQDLLKSDGVSKQEVDQAVGTLHTDEGKLAAAIADVNRWKEMETFKQVRAPFAGNIYSRTTDTGALIAAGPTAVLFRLADVSTLRIFTNVTENYAHKIKVGMTGTIEVPADPGKKFIGTVTHTAGTLDPATRTLLTELQMPNAQHLLTTGSYCQVTFKIASPSSSLILAASALLFRASGAEVAVVDETGKVHMHSVKLGRDFGRTVEVLGGLTAEDTVILNPADSIGEGALVKPVPAEKAQ
jgi:RND family efflux transporter MFP subunit